jgi:hypothetical protein
MVNGARLLISDTVTITGLACKFLLFVAFTIGLERIAYHFAYYTALSPWLLFPLSGTIAFLPFRYPDFGVGRFRSRQLRGASLAAALMFCATSINNPISAHRGIMEGKVDRLVAAYARSATDGRAAMIRADDQLFEAASSRLPPALVKAEGARRNGIRVAMRDAELKAEKKAREEQRRRDEAFANSHLGKALTVITFGLWLLGLVK